MEARQFTTVAPASTTTTTITPTLTITSFHPIPTLSDTVISDANKNQANVAIHIAIAIISTLALVAVVYMLANFIRKHRKQWRKSPDVEAGTAVDERQTLPRPGRLSTIPE
ncbi:hypothetical protein SAMD00023353_0900150 [Rosellinia necatrix]|uniref:Uncharacterized protein n=1 Tax=Rosellinia necatrix TaxID=77044 RepID=A0A1S8A642_ROSNE|nr:hypothetical protein SAMD00023353_0900150 [Rosellinia necatrix]